MRRLSILFVLTFMSSCLLALQADKPNSPLSTLHSEEKLHTEKTLHSPLSTLNSEFFALRHLSDTLSVLALLNAEGDTTGTWQFPYPTWKMETGDLNGDGKDEALVGVVKRTRFDAVTARRLFIFKNVKGRVRPLWLGTTLGGGRLVDFRLSSQQIIALEESAPAIYNVSIYAPAKFGLSFVAYIVRGVGYEEAREAFVNHRAK